MSIIRSTCKGCYNNYILLFVLKGVEKKEGGCNPTPTPHLPSHRFVPAMCKRHTEAHILSKRLASAQRLRVC